MRYKTEKELISVLEGFENGTIERRSWGHHEHLIVAYYYAGTYDLEAAIGKMREGLLCMLAGFGADVAQVSPYHETLTVFWMNVVFEFASTNKGVSDFVNCARLTREFGKDFPFKFYSRELLFSDRARREFVDPDILR